MGALPEWTEVSKPIRFCHRRKRPFLARLWSDFWLKNLSFEDP